MKLWNSDKYEKDVGGVIAPKKEDLLTAVGPLGACIPEFRDERALHSPTDNQGNNPCCVGCDVADWLEVQHYLETYELGHQFDFMAIYRQAKKRDGNDTPGTTLYQGVKAAMDLGFIDPKRKIVQFRKFRQVAWALTTQRCVIAAFSIDSNWYMPNGDGFIIDHPQATARGGHAVPIDSYHLYLKDPGKSLQDENNWDEERSWIGIHNSWGDGYGCGGHARLSLKLFNRQFISAVYLHEPE